ncbi:MAG TPA: glycosyltransferase family 39 protein [Bryobacteraceae bacterium]|jgi:4-amino-4-deoxy-L-arabinose transferase-like glycosyltransferase|nr:glycosyltransferase family 39 protein [Bryobacteraceae bacterium]
MHAFLRTGRLVMGQWPIAALLVLFGILYSFGLNSYGMFLWDEAEYASIGRSVLHGQGFAISGVPNKLRPPILPLAGAAGLFLFGEQSGDLVLRGIAGGFALLALLCVYGFATAGFDRTTGFAAAALLGMSPFFWTYVPYFLSEIPFLLFFTAAVWCFYFGAYRDQRFFLWSWIFWALAFLTRYTASLFLPVILLFIALAWWRGGADTRRRLMSRWFFLSPLAGLLLLAPWFGREYIAFGNALAGLKQASQQLQVYMPEISMPWNYYLRRMPALLSLGIAVLFAAGLIWAVCRRDRFSLHNVLVAAVILAWFSCYRYKEDRMVSSALPFMAVVAAVFLGQAWPKLRPPARGAVLAVLLAGIFFLNLRIIRPVLEHRVTLGYPGFLDGMAFLRENASPGAVVLGANFPQIHWYTNLRAEDIPEENELPEALRHSEWVVITNFEPAQKPYVLSLAHLVPLDPTSHESAVFRDKDLATVVVRSQKLLQALGR